MDASSSAPSLALQYDARTSYSRLSPDESNNRGHAKDVSGHES